MEDLETLALNASAGLRLQRLCTATGTSPTTVQLALTYLLRRGMIYRNARRQYFPALPEAPSGSWQKDHIILSGIMDPRGVLSRSQ